jgi:hypothetical protein
LDRGELRRAAFEESRYGHVTAATWITVDAALGHAEPLPFMTGSETRPVRGFIEVHGPWIGGIIGCCVLLLGIMLLYLRIFGGSDSASLFRRGLASVYIQSGGGMGSGGSSHDINQE